RQGSSRCRAPPHGTHQPVRNRRFHQLMNQDMAIEARSLSKRYGRRHAVADVSFRVPTGRITGFLGPNGAGKTTTLRMLAGLIRPSSGSSRLLGEAVPGPALRSVGAMI